MELRSLHSPPTSHSPPCLTTHCAARGAPAPSSLGGTETHDHGHPGPPLLVLIDARPHGPQTVRGHPKARRSLRGHGKTASPPGLEAQVRPPRCGAALSGAVPTLGGASRRGSGAARGRPTQRWGRQPTAGGRHKWGQRAGAGGIGPVLDCWDRALSRRGWEGPSLGMGPPLGPGPRAGVSQ